MHAHPGRDTSRSSPTVPCAQPRHHMLHPGVCETLCQSSNGLLSLVSRAAVTVSNDERTLDMPQVTTSDGVPIFYKAWGPKDAQPIMFHHGWPLSADDWDAQMLFFLQHGYRVV